MNEQLAPRDKNLERVIDRLNKEMKKAYKVERMLAELREMMLMNTIPKGDVLRVEINEDGTFNLLDFSLMPENGRKRLNVPQSEVPQWIMEAVSMLRIADEGNLIPELGFKVSDLLYYVVDKTGESK